MAFVMSEPQVQAYKRDGFFVLENAYSPDEIAALNRETVALCRQGAFKVWEREGRDTPVLNLPSTATDMEILAEYLCIHFPHKISDVMKSTLAHPNTVEILSKVIGPNVKCMQSMLFIKSAGKPGQAWHQDEDYIPTRDRSMTGAWIAMDDATVKNGCLWVIPGSQRHGVLWPQKWHGDTRFDCAEESYQFPYQDSDAVPVEVKAGSLIVFNGYLLHRSLPNLTENGLRRSLVNHYMSAESLLPWHHPKEGESMATADYRDIVLVCGKDPYAYKGVENIAGPHVRSTGKGGCGNNQYNLKATQAA
jgi:ectoine hydroxylase-related dioxygenase (phytanoyl-CoA dioxygenase family)